MANILSMTSARAQALREQQLERRRQQSGHCTCVVAPAPPDPPKLEWTAAGWRCSVCKAMIAGKR